MPLTPQEHAVLDLLGQVYDAIAALPELHPADLAESVRDIHDLQNRILARPEYLATLTQKKS